MSRYYPCAEGCPHAGYCDRRIIMLCRIAFDRLKNSTKIRR